MDQAVVSNQHIGVGLHLQDMPMNIWVADRHRDSISGALKSKNGAKPGQYSLSERKLRAAAFAERVHRLKYYITLLASNTIS